MTARPEGIVHHKQGTAFAMPPAWRSALLYLAVLALASVTLTGPAWRAMATQWWNISTYNHILLIPPIIAWLIWTRLPVLATLGPKAWPPGLAGFTGALMVWAGGSLTDVNTFAQAGAVAALVMATLTMLGPRVTSTLAFPLAYAVFLVPFGDELVPTLQYVTAQIAIALTHLAGVPAQIEGIYIHTPAGLFIVAEACSGVMFLVAMVALGVLVAHLCYRGWRKRLIFLGACVIVPILANGVRAWGTIYLAQFVGAEVAGGIDHIIYGWVFFAIVVTAILALSWRSFDRTPEDIEADLLARAGAKRFDARERSGVNPPWVFAIAIILMAVFALVRITVSG